MRLGRYQEAPSSLSFFRGSQKITPKNTSRSAFKNPELTTDMKLPTLSNSMNMRSSAVSLGSDRNTKNKLHMISRKVEELESELHNARLDAHETLNHMRFLKEELLEKQLAQSNEDMQGQIQGLKKLVKITKNSHQQRSNDLREDYIRLWNQTEEMRELVFSLTMRTEKLDETMGMKQN